MRHSSSPSPTTDRRSTGLRGLAARLCLAWLLLLPGFGHAFTLDPISQVLAPAGSGAQASYQLTNPGSEPIAVEFDVAHLVKHLDGSEDLSQREREDFLIFPPQMVIPAGATRTVRVRWLGDPDPERELAFRFLAEQVPVALEEPDDTDKVAAEVRLYYRFHGTLFVRPRGAEPALELTDVQWLHGANGDGLRLRIENPGTMRGWVRSFELELVVDGEAHSLDETTLPALGDLPVLAGGAREVIAPWPEGLPVAQPTAAFIRLRRAK